MVKIKILRHSERLDYAHPLYWVICFGQYWADPPLTSKGHSTANIKGKNMISDSFDPKHIYTSPYTRTMETAAEIKAAFPNTEIIIEPLLAENQPKYKHKINLYPNGIPTIYNGKETGFTYPETDAKFSSRVIFIISKLIEKNNDDFIIVTHGGVLKAYVNYIQSLYPDIVLKPENIPYLTVLTFEFDKRTNKIDEQTIKME